MKSVCKDAFKLLSSFQSVGLFHTDVCDNGGVHGMQ